jgi:hypothetical protein
MFDANRYPLAVVDLELNLRLGAVVRVRLQGWLMN